MSTLPHRKKDLTADTLDLCHRFCTTHVFKLGTKKPKGGLHYRKLCIHIADCIERGTISPMEGYDIEKFLLSGGYLPEWIDARESAYSKQIN